MDRKRDRHNRPPSPFRDRVRDGVLERFALCCRQWLHISEFRPAPKVKHGRLYRCKLCYVRSEHGGRVRRVA